MGTWAAIEWQVCFGGGAGTWGFWSGLPKMPSATMLFLQRNRNSRDQEAPREQKAFPAIINNKCFKEACEGKYQWVTSGTAMAESHALYWFQSVGLPWGACKRWSYWLRIQGVEEPGNLHFKFLSDPDHRRSWKIKPLANKEVNFGVKIPTFEDMNKDDLNWSVIILMGTARQH